MFSVKFFKKDKCYVVNLIVITRFTDKQNLKIVIFKDHTKKGICFTEDDLYELKQEYGGVYKLPYSEYYIDYYSYKNLVYNKKHIVFIALETDMAVKSGEYTIPIFTLQYLSNENVNKFALGELTTEVLDTSYSKPNVLGKGSYGEVTFYPHQDFVVKKFTSEGDKIPQDILIEIAIYQLFSDTKCLVDMKGFDLETLQVFMTRGASTLNSAMQTFTKKQLPFWFFNLALCLRDIKKS